jgi:acyl-CoA synthetase (AMP-forming)/AMP-acid ligase II
MATAMIDELLARGQDSRTAVVDPRGALSRAELRAAVEAAAAELRRSGVGAGDLVGVSATAEIATVVALLAARSVDAVVCPFDPAQRASVCARLHPRAVLARAEAGPVAAVGIELPTDWTAREPIAAAWGIQTSGSTGTPKTVLLTELSAASITAWSGDTIGYRADDRVYSPLSLHHILGLSQIWVSLRAGATLVLPPPGQQAGNFVAWAKDATLLPGVPLFVRWLCKASDKPALRVVTLGGQPTIPEDRTRFAAAFPRTEFFNIYGLTEAFRAIWLHPDEFVSRPEASGRPATGMRAWLDDEELVLEGAHVAMGYLDNPESSARKFPAPHTVRTGDLFRFDGDVFTYEGRRDTVFKSHGEKVVPEVVERALESHPRVQKALVSHVRVGPELRAVAYVIANGPAPDAGELATYLRDRVPAVMIPATFHFVDKLPTTASGKLRRHIDPSGAAS